MVPLESPASGPSFHLGAPAESAFGVSFGVCEGWFGIEGGAQGAKPHPASYVIFIYDQLSSCMIMRYVYMINRKINLCIDLSVYVGSTCVGKLLLLNVMSALPF